MATEGGAVEENPFGPDCLCEWDRMFEGEQSGWVYYLTVVAKRCPKHGKKPRWVEKVE